jgi:hypothetical protein
MDITQLFLAVVACVGIVIVGLLAIVPTALELPRSHNQHQAPNAGAQRPPAAPATWVSFPAPSPLNHRRRHHGQETMRIAA